MVSKENPLPTLVRGSLHSSKRKTQSEPGQAAHGVLFTILPEMFFLYLRSKKDQEKKESCSLIEEKGPHPCPSDP